MPQQNRQEIAYLACQMETWRERVNHPHPHIGWQRGIKERLTQVRTFLQRGEKVAQLRVHLVSREVRRSRTTSARARAYAGSKVRHQFRPP